MAKIKSWRTPNCGANLTEEMARWAKDDERWSTPRAFFSRDDIELTRTGRGKWLWVGRVRCYPEVFIGHRLKAPDGKRLRVTYACRLQSQCKFLDLIPLARQGPALFRFSTFIR